MSKEVTLDKIRDIVFKKNNVLPGGEIGGDVDLFDEGYLDSFSVMQLVQSLEEEFGLVFDYSDLRRDYFCTLNSIMGLLVKKYGVKKSK